VSNASYFKSKFTKNIFILIFLILSKIEARAQQDTAQLPFAIANEKKLCEEDCKNKKEGIYFTGLPDISQDPSTDLATGRRFCVFQRKTQRPFFKYTPYRKKIDIRFFNTTKDQRELKLGLDIPYIFNTKWRFRFEAAYEVNPNLLYFGTTEKSLQGLSYVNNSGETVTNAEYSTMQII